MADDGELGSVDLVAPSPVVPVRARWTRVASGCLAVAFGLSVCCTPLVTKAGWWWFAGPIILAHALFGWALGRGRLWPMWFMAMLGPPGLAAGWIICLVMRGAPLNFPPPEPPPGEQMLPMLIVATWLAIPLAACLWIGWREGALTERQNSEWFW